MQKTIRLKDWVEQWLGEILPTVVKPTTIQMYEDTMKRHILPGLGDECLADISSEKVKDWLQKLSKTVVPGTQNGQMTEGSIRNTLSVLSGCLRDAQKQGLIACNPCKDIGWVLEPKNLTKSQEWLNEEEIRELMPQLASYQDQDGYPLGLGFQLVLYTGITLSEASALRWQDVDLEKEVLYIRSFLAFQHGVEESGDPRYEVEELVGRKNREVPVPTFLIRQLKELKQEYEPAEESFVLSRSEKEPMSLDRMRKALSRRAASCGMEKVTPRMLRDTYAMRAVKAGASSDMIAELMGFASSKQVIRRYMPMRMENKRELINKMYQ